MNNAYAQVHLYFFLNFLFCLILLCLFDAVIVLDLGIAKVSKASDQKVGLIGQAQGYFSESVDEFKKISRPTAAEARQATIVTVALVIFVALTVALFDLLFSQLMKVVIY